MTYHVLVTAESTIEVEAGSEEEAKESAKAILHSNFYAWDFMETTIL